MRSRNQTNLKRSRRSARTRAKIFGTAARPRLSLFRSNRFLYAQLIDDEKGVTIISSSSRKEYEKNAKGKTDSAYRVGEAIAEKALKMGVKSAIFDRRFYKYHGRVKALAEGARSGGLKI